MQDSEDVEFPERLERAVAAITKGFSFAYIQEAFVAALLAIANGDADDEEKEVDKKTACVHNDEGDMTGLVTLEVGDDDDLERYVLWREIKKVVKTLREELGSEK